MMLILVVCLICLGVINSQIIVNIEAGKSNDVGIFFPGEKDFNHEIYKVNQKEQLLSVVPKGKNVRELVKFGSGMILRSSDFENRVRIEVSNTNEGSGNPYLITAYNLACGDRGGDSPIELQHSNSGYIWIDGCKKVGHFTDVMHPFTFRSSDKEMIFTITLHPVADEL